MVMIIYERFVSDGPDHLFNAAVAQSVERRIGSAEVTGPIPVSSLMKNVVKSTVTSIFDQEKSILKKGAFLDLTSI